MVSIDHKLVVFCYPSEEALAFWGRDLVLGAVSLFDQLDPDVSWVDVSCVVRSAGRDDVIHLAIFTDSPWTEVHDENTVSGTDDEVDDRGYDEIETQHLLVPNLLPTGVFIPELRDAMTDPRRTFWASENAGLGVIVMALVVLDP